MENQHLTWQVLPQTFFRCNGNFFVVPQLTVLTIAIIGIVVDGVKGFFVWGIIGLVGVLALGGVGWFFNGGLIPRKVRDEIATDFVAAYGEAVKLAFPSLTPFQAKEKVAALLDDMYKRANWNNRSMHLGLAAHPRVFLPSALEVAEEQSSESARALGLTLVHFVFNHPSWYGRS